MEREELIKCAIKKLDCLEEELKDYCEMLNNINAERETIRYLLFLGFEKDKN